MLTARPFAPQGNGVTVALGVTTLPASAQFDNILPPDGIARKSGAVRLFNAGPATVFVELTGSAVPAAVVAGSGLPLAAGAAILLGTQGATHLAAVTGAGAATLYATPGEGGI